MIGTHMSQAGHRFEKNDAERWEAICGTVPERWTRPDETDRVTCAFCLAAERRREDPAPSVEKRLAGLWPRALTASGAIRLHPALRTVEDVVALMDRLREAGRVIEVETESGRKRWAARRVVVEEYGRTYGMR